MLGQPLRVTQRPWVLRRSDWEPCLGRGLGPPAGPECQPWVQGGLCDLSTVFGDRASRPHYVGEEGLGPVEPKLGQILFGECSWAGCLKNTLCVYIFILRGAWVCGRACVCVSLACRRGEAGPGGGRWGKGSYISIPLPWGRRFTSLPSLPRCGHQVPALRACSWWLSPV